MVVILSIPDILIIPGILMNNGHEFFAQLSNAYLGTNAGKDPYVGTDRHNTKKWVEDHEPEMYTLLEKMYGGAKVENANPKKP